MWCELPLLNKENKTDFLAAIKNEYEKLKNDFGNKKSAFKADFFIMEVYFFQVFH